MNARTTDPQTSKDAAKRVKPTPYMMLMLAQFAKKSMTSEEAAEAANLLNTGYWKRTSDLFNAGYVVPRLHPSGKVMTRTNRSGRQAQVWKITAIGRIALRIHNNKNR